jgi:hypothetical protein
VIDSSSLPISVGVIAFDVDQDGDLDIILGSDASDNKVWWWENPFPNYNPNIPWTRREIKNTGNNKHHDFLIGDFDGDGKVELVFWNQGAKKLFIADIPKDPKENKPWLYTEIFSWDSGEECEGLASFDIDGDGKLDIVGCGRWFKHNGGTSYTANLIDDSQRCTRSASGQLKKGGWAEVVFGPGDGVGRLKWYEWTGKEWKGHDLLGENVIHGHSLQVADINGDGNLDIFCAEMRQWSADKDDNPNARMWVFLGDGRGNFKKMVLGSGHGSHETMVADMDGDGDLDLLIKPYIWDTPRIDVWLNNGTKNGLSKLSLDRWQRHVLDPEKPWRSVFIAAGDVDGDGHKDVVTGGWWYKNPGNPMGAWERHVIGSPLNNMAALYDFDDDRHLDILGTEGKGAEANSKFVWGRNDGKGNFAIHRNIGSAKGDFLQGVAVAPLTNLGAVKVALSWHKAGMGIQMLTIPSKPISEIWTWRSLSNTSQDEQITVGDINLDGKLDLLLGTRWLCNDCPLSKTSWLKWITDRFPRLTRRFDRLLGAKGLGWRIQTLSATDENPDRNRLADMNGDGRLDAIVGFEAVSVPGKLAWYEQPLEPTNYWKEHLIATVIGPMSLDVADMDGDGDMDVIVGEHNLKEPSKAKLYIFENADRRGTRWIQHLVHEGDEHHDGAIVVDIDGDGDLDIISIGWGHGKVLLYENKAIDKRKK